MGPEEFSYLPSDANAVAFANVGAIMSSPFTQKLREVLPTGEEKAKMQEALGIDIERDIDSVIAGRKRSWAWPRTGIVLVRGRFNTGHLEALAMQHGGGRRSTRARNSSCSATKTGPTRFPAATPFAAVAFFEPNLLAFGERSAIEAAIDTKTTGRGRDQERGPDEARRRGAGGKRLVGRGQLRSIRQSANVPAEVRSTSRPCSGLRSAPISTAA